MYNFDMLTFTLAAGRIVRLERLFQSMSYEGVLAGLPSEHLNEYVVQHLIERARSVAAIGSGAPVVLVPPRIRTWEPEPGKRIPFLPEVECIAHLTSEPTSAGDGVYRSRLTVVWFQHALAPPIDVEVEQFIRNLRWEQLAEDYAP